MIDVSVREVILERVVEDLLVGTHRRQELHQVVRVQVGGLRGQPARNVGVSDDFYTLRNRIRL